MGTTAAPTRTGSRHYRVMERAGTNAAQPVPLVGKQKAVLTHKGARGRLNERLAHWIDAGATSWRTWEAQDGSGGFVAERDGVFVASVVMLPMDAD